MKKKWTVWVGGSEVNDYNLTEDKAKRLAEDYIIADGYGDVFVQNLSNNKTYRLIKKWEEV